MKYPHGSRRVTGVLVPVAALRSDQSVGCGEFADLPALAQWCTSAGLEMIQLLPVNDTGGESSPYSALSAYALHPLYLRIADLPEMAELPLEKRNSIAVALDQMRTSHESTARFDYFSVLTGKMNLLRTIFLESRREILQDPVLHRFVGDNPWLPPYAVFRALKEKQQHRSWTTWDEYRDIDEETLKKLWDDPALEEATRFFAWIQLRLTEQFRAASDAAGRCGVALKGDIPILMSEDSVDAWYDRDVFRPQLRAGAPPDMFSELGQNWGFPIYNWQHLERSDYEWWRERLRQASRFYHAYRIDHVLGFFRIWAIPAANFSGIPGFFWPQKGITREEMYEAGFDEGRIRWLAEPHLPGEALRACFGEEWTSLIGTLLSRIGEEDLFLFSPEIRGELDLVPAKERDSRPAFSEEQSEWLLAQYRDRALVEMPDGSMASTWTFRDCTRYSQLSGEERAAFEALVARHDRQSNELWADHGRKLLHFMRKTTDMLTCAEDLGVVPEAVPRVLEELDVLSLRIPRWSHYWDQPGQPLIPLEEYPEGSVCAASVHDTSTMRGWWEKESGREQLWESLGLKGPCPTTFDPATARAVFRGLTRCASRILVFQLQDFLALTPELTHAEPDEERINIPGTSTPFNWTWRMPVTIEVLQKHQVLSKEIRALAKSRHKRKD